MLSAHALICTNREKVGGSRAAFLLFFFVNRRSGCFVVGAELFCLRIAVALQGRHLVYSKLDEEKQGCVEATLLSFNDTLERAQHILSFLNLLHLP